MKRISAWFAALVVAAGMSSIPLPGRTVQFPDGRVAFAQPPRLVGASTTQNSTYVWGATYYFILSLSESAGEPLQQVTIVQQRSPDTVRFDLEDTRAYEGKREKGARLTLSSVTQDRETKAITVAFDPPIAPGKTVTIALRPVRNPDVGGVYLFGVTAFPAGQKPLGQFLGFGRLQFYDPGRDSSFFYHGPFIHR